MAGQYDNLFQIAGPGKQTVLPAHSRVIRLVFGDSNATGQNTLIASLAEQSLRGNKAVTSVVTRPNATYFDKWLHLTAGDWVTSERLLMTGYDPDGAGPTPPQVEATYAFQPLTDHLSFAAPTDATDLGTGTGLHISWLMDTWASKLLGTYLDAKSGALCPVHYVVAGVPGAYMADSGVGATTYQDGYANGTYELLVDHYAKAAINLALSEAQTAANKAEGYEGTDRNAPAVVFVECLFWTAGGYDLQNATYAAEIGQNMARLQYSLTADLGGRVPTVWTRPWDTDYPPYTNYAAAQASFDALFGDFGDHPTDFVRVEGAGKFAEQSATVFPGIHWQANAASLIARRWCAAVGRMAERGCTLLPVPTALS